MGFSDPLGLIKNKTEATLPEAESKAESQPKKESTSESSSAATDDSYMSALLSTAPDTNKSGSLAQSAKPFCESCEKAAEMTGDKALAEMTKNLDEIGRQQDSRASQSPSSQKQNLPNSPQTSRPQISTTDKSPPQLPVRSNPQPSRSPSQSPLTKNQATMDKREPVSAQFFAAKSLMQPKSTSIGLFGSPKSFTPETKTATSQQSLSRPLLKQESAKAQNSNTVLKTPPKDVAPNVKTQNLVSQNKINQNSLLRTPTETGFVKTVRPTENATKLVLNPTQVQKSEAKAVLPFLKWISGQGVPEKGRSQFQFAQLTNLSLASGFLKSLQGLKLFLSGLGEARMVSATGSLKTQVLEWPRSMQNVVKFYFQKMTGTITFGIQKVGEFFQQSFLKVSKGLLKVFETFKWVPHFNGTLQPYLALKRLWEKWRRRLKRKTDLENEESDSDTSEELTILSKPKSVKIIRRRLFRFRRS